MSKETSDRPVLIPVDFSRYSEAALLVGAELAGCLNAPLLLLHVVHDPGEMPGYYSRAFKKKKLHRIEDAATEMLEEFLQRMMEQHPKLAENKRLETLLVKGLPTTRILEVAKKRDARMIVVGSKGLTGIKHIVIGSVAERVVHTAKVPVTVVKADA